MKAKINGYDIEGSVDEIRLLIGQKKEVVGTNIAGAIKPRKNQRKNQPWTKKEDEWVQRCRGLGVSYKTIARDLGRTSAACSARHWQKKMEG